MNRAARSLKPILEADDAAPTALQIVPETLLQALRSPPILRSLTPILEDDDDRKPTIFVHQAPQPKAPPKTHRRRRVPTQPIPAQGPLWNHHPHANRTGTTDYPVPVVVERPSFFFRVLEAAVTPVAPGWIVAAFFIGLTLARLVSFWHR